RGALLRSGDGGGAHLGDEYEVGRPRLRVSLFVLARHVGTAGRRRRVERRGGKAAPRGYMDGVDQAGLCDHHDRCGRVLSPEGGTGVVLIDGRRRMADGGRPYRGFVAALITACLIAIPLRAQESGIPVGSAAPGAKLERLD